MYEFSGMEQAGEKRNMSALEKKVDALLLFCTADTEDTRRIYHQGLRQLIMLDPALAASDRQRRVDQFLADLGIPDHLVGYMYLQTAIEVGLQHPDAVFSVTNLIYPMVAQRLNVRPTAVERCIRSAIEVGWTRCDLDMQQKYFGGKVNPNRSKPTNAEFIARACNVLRRQGS